MAIGKTAQELADALGCRLPSVRKWTLVGMPYEPVGSLRFYDEEAVRAWLRQTDEKKMQERRQRHAEKMARQARVEHVA